MTKKVAIVTGSSSGIGFETSLMLAKNGFNVYATMRDLSKSEKIRKIADDNKLPLEVGQLDVIWLERKGGSSKQRQEEREKTLSQEMMYQFQGAEGSWVWPHCTLHSGNIVRY